MKLLRYLPRFQKAYRALGAMAQREQWGRAEIEGYQLERLNRLWRHAIAHVPYYRDLRRAQSLPVCFESLSAFQQSVPLLSKAPVQEKPMAFLSEQREPGHWAFTSGSTGTTTRVYWGKKAHLEMLRARYRLCERWGIDIFDRAVYLWGHGASTQPGWRGTWAGLLRSMTDRLRNRKRLLPYQLDTPTLRRYLEIISRYGPRWMYAFSSVAYLLAREIPRQWHCETLRWICLSAEPVSPPMINTIERAFGAPVSIEYGSVECGFLASGNEPGRLTVREDQCLLETIPGEDGQWHVAVTVLNNPSFPLIRYLLGDTTGSPLEYPDRGFAVLPSFIGRDHDFVLSGTGDYVHPFRFDDLFESDPRVRAWQVHQFANGSVQVRVQSSGKGTSVPVGSYQGRLEALVNGFPVSLEIVPQLPRSRAGKHRWITSEMAQPDAIGHSELTAMASLEQ